MTKDSVKEHSGRKTVAVSSKAEATKIADKTAKEKELAFPATEPVKHETTYKKSTILPGKATKFKRK